MSLLTQVDLVCNEVVTARYREFVDAKEHPGWGAPKIRDKLIRAFPMIKPPATSTVAVLDRHGLVKRRKRRRHEV